MYSKLKMKFHYLYSLFYFVLHMNFIYAPRRKWASTSSFPINIDRETFEEIPDLNAQLGQSSYIEFVHPMSLRLSFEEMERRFCQRDEPYDWPALNEINVTNRHAWATLCVTLWGKSQNPLLKPSMLCTPTKVTALKVKFQTDHRLSRSAKLLKCKCRLNHLVDYEIFFATPLSDTEYFILKQVVVNGRWHISDFLVVPS